MKLLPAKCASSSPTAVRCKNILNVIIFSVALLNAYGKELTNCYEICIVSGCVPTQNGGEHGIHQLRSNVYFIL
jgi:hypothetical protein